MIREAHLGSLIEGLAGVLFCWLLVVAPSVLASVPDLSTQAEQIELRIENDATVVVEGLGDAATLSRAAAFSDDDWRNLLNVVARDPERSAEGTELPPLLGRFDLDGSALRFTPRFPPAPGLIVEARFSARNWHGDEAFTGSDILTASFAIPRSDAVRTTRVEAVYPATETVPANLLRFYVHFNAPMGARHVLPHVELLDEDGHAIDTAFVEVEGGLWDPTRSRLTLFIHPGRVKRGVGPHQAMGPVLEEGRSYTLRVGEEATDDFGRRLAEPYEQAFKVGPEDHASPDPGRWMLTPPASPNGALRVELIEPADIALLLRMPVVVDADGSQVDGQIDVSSDGLSFAFRAYSSWVPGEYELRIPSTLEDASGNRVGREFEERPDPAGMDPESPEPRWVSRSFRINA